MRDKYIQTAESVTEGHPDKLCDTIADAVLDACLHHDSHARVACEVMATAGKIIVAGEITAKELPDIPAIVCRTVRETGYTSSYEVEVITHDQSGDIAGAVSNEYTLGAGDQGIVYGYACNETSLFLPMPAVLANRLTLLLTNARRTGTIYGLGPDGKAQVSVEYEGGVPKRLAAVVVSCQHDANKNLEQLRREIIRSVITPALRDLYPDDDTEILINPSGRFVLGGFEADTGLTGRKLMVDTYGGIAPHGGGALSGKDATKMDRSGAYMARYVAKNIVAAGLADRCTVIPLWAVTLLGSLFIWVLSLVMILTVYSRFFKLYMATAIAPIPLSSFAGQPSSSIGMAFIRSYAAICLEGCMIVLSCIIFSQFASTPPAIADTSLSATTIVWNYIGELIFNMLVLVGTIKMSDRIVRELMGLG